MKKIRVLSALFIAFTMSACASISDKIVDGTHAYCTRATSIERSFINSTVNTALAEKGHRIDVTCAGDN